MNHTKITSKMLHEIAENISFAGDKTKIVSNNYSDIYISPIF